MNIKDKEAAKNIKIESEVAKEKGIISNYFICIFYQDL